MSLVRLLDNFGMAILHSLLLFSPLPSLSSSQRPARGRRTEPASCHASPELTLPGVTHPLPPPVPLKPLRVLRYCRLALIAIILRQTVQDKYQ